MGGSNTAPTDMQVTHRASEKDNTVITQTFLKDLEAGGLLVHTLVPGNIIEV
jgi:hypothetical protein